jgi:hypothetical protein
MPVPPDRAPDRGPNRAASPDHLYLDTDSGALIPQSVWATSTPSPPGHASEETAARLIATYSYRGSTIALTMPDPVLSAAGRYLHRQVLIRPVPHDRGDIPDRPARRALSSSRRGTIAVDLIIDRPPLRAAETILSRHIHLAATLRPDGYLLTLHTPTGGPIDPVAVSIAAARAAGLRYLQHLILLATPIIAGQLQPVVYRQPRADRLLTPAHTDVAVFTTGGAHA